MPQELVGFLEWVNSCQLDGLLILEDVIKNYLVGKPTVPGPKASNI
jgi:hypothetical protein